MNKRVHFGTDGVRGKANLDLTPQFALRLGMAAATVLGRHSDNQPIIVGRDTRLSGDMLESALNAGLASMGATAIRIGIAPTPAVAYITGTVGACAGAVISASHNPFDDNGIKFLGPEGGKLPDETECEIETELGNLEHLSLPVEDRIGRVKDNPELLIKYACHLKSTSQFPLKGMSLVVDCANGAGFEIAPQIFSDLGADVIPISNSPNGTNINRDCGSTHPEAMCIAVKKQHALAGLALDGDCDRVIMADEKGHIIDGDRLMAICAIELARQEQLSPRLVVATIMSNVGLEKALERHHIGLIRTNVGDRYVAAEMSRTGALIGGEQSGHILFRSLMPTGDGILTALQVLDVAVGSGRPLSELASVVEQYPQLLKNVRVSQRLDWDKHPKISRAILGAQEKLGCPDWLSVRPSGTEPVIRVMAQGTDPDVVQEVVNSLCELLVTELGAPSQ